MSEKKSTIKKKNPLDFSLWKPAKKGEQSFDSPWGLGRPGWHIECTAMIQKHLGTEIDIHGGGLDLLFPHHENEIAQAEGSCPGSHYVKYWVHNNMFTFSGTKMSKSLGNTKTMRVFLNEYPGEVFKFMVLTTHYRSEVDFSDRSISKAMDGLSRIYSSLSWAYKAAQNDKEDANLIGEAIGFECFIKEKKESILNHYNHDFATPKVFSEFFEIIRCFNTLFPLNSKLTPEKKEMALILLEFFKEEGSKLSLFQEKPFKDFLKSMDRVLLKKIDVDETWVEEKIKNRLEAKKQKDFSTADKIRKKLQDKFILLKDSLEGTDWEVDKNTFFKTKN